MVIFAKALFDPEPRIVLAGEVLIKMTDCVCCVPPNSLGGDE